MEATPGSHGPDITPKFAEGLMPRRRIDRKAPDTFRSRTSSTIDVGVAKGFLADSNSTVDYSMTGSILIKRMFITNVKGTFLGMSESEEASKRR